MKVRECVESDLPQLCEIARAFVEESAHDFVYSPEVAEQTWRRYIADDSMAVLAVVRGERILGGAVVAHDRPFTLNRVGYLIKFYFLPAYRRTRGPILAIEAANLWFDAHHCWAVFATAVARIGTNETFEKLLTRHGYAPCGPTFVRRP